MTSSRSRLAYTAPFITVVLLLLTAGNATAGQSATFIGASVIPGSNNLDIDVGIPKNIANQSFSGKKDWQIDVSITYLSVNNTIETVDTGVVPISSWAEGQTLGNTTPIGFTVSLGTRPLPGNQPSTTGVVTLIKP